jgi:hypothetical protein
MNTITITFLRAQVKRLNIETMNPIAPYVREGEKSVAQIGNYHLSGAYGGYSLHRIETDGGGISDVFGCGHISKRDLSARISAMRVGIDAWRDLLTEGKADRLDDMDE